MRFQTSRALDAIELRVRTDPVQVGAVVDLREAVRLPGPDGRPANLLRLGLVIDALSAQLADERVALYVVGDRGVLSDTDLTSNERMVLRRWSDDGLIEIIPAGADAVARMCEVAWALSLPVITGRSLNGFNGVRYVPVPASGSLTFVAGGNPAPVPRIGPLSRLWRCAVPGCPSFPNAPTQPPPQVAANGVPVCPRHVERLADVGPRPPVVPIGLRVGGVVRYRFALPAGAPLTVGRAPDGPGAVVLGPYLGERVAPRVSRSHLRMELRDDRVVVTDLSTNGSLLSLRPDRTAQPRLEALPKGMPYALGEWDAVELAEGVVIARADRAAGGQPPTQTASVMQDAPTIAIRLPKM